MPKGLLLVIPTCSITLNYTRRKLKGNGLYTDIDTRDFPLGLPYLMEVENFRNLRSPWKRKALELVNLVFEMLDEL